MIFPNHKKSQVTIFIIFGLIIVVLIAIFLLLKFGNQPITEIFDKRDPQGSMETCTRQAVEEALDRIGINGGDIIPGHSVFYKNDYITYICYSGVDYQPCSYNRPLLVEHIEREITDYITPRIENCFKNLRLKLEKSYESIEETPGIQVNTNLFPKHVEIKIKKNFQIVNEGRTISFDNFKIDILHPIYDFADIAMQAANQQSKYCYFDSLGYMIMNPTFNINETITGKSDRIYVLTDRTTEHKFQFAIRSCPLPPGY
jgi:hypothetical protein